MAAQQSSRPNNQDRVRDEVAVAPLMVPPLRKTVALQDPEDMVLLREKLNQIAVGRRYVGDNQVDHLSSSDNDFDDGCAGAHRSPPGHFRLFVSTGDRPSTPPSSPQPRDLLRKQLRMKNHRPFYTPAQSNSCEDNSSDTASDEPLEGMCVDAIEISPLPEDDDDDHRLPTHPSVRLSVPEHLRAMSSSYSVLTKCPEGFRKRKSVHIDGKDVELDDQSVVAPLKKVSSHVNVLGWEKCGASTENADQNMDGMPDSPTGSVSSCS